MLTIPASLRPYLHTQGVDPVEVYEIVTLGGTTLRYSDQTLTWGGNAYTGLAVARSPIKESMEFSVPECSVTFANATNVLRDYLTPDDVLTGAKLTVRILFKNRSTQAILTDSFVRFVGKIDPPREVSEDAFELVAKGPLDGQGTQIPPRKFTITCGWDFANKSTFDGSGHCPYVSTTQANGAGSSSTALVVDSGSKFANGDSIQIGGGAAVTISSGGGTVNLTLSDARTWADNDLVRFADCPGRTSSECDSRGMLHRFGGHPGVSSIARQKIKNARLANNQGNREAERGSRQDDRRDKSSAGGSSSVSRLLIEAAAGDEFADPTVPVPILYGRRRVKPRLVEMLRRVLDDIGYKVGFYVISEGEIDTVVRFWVDDDLGTDLVESSVKVFGIYYRDGDHGVNDSETEAEYSASPTTQLRSQNIDYRSLAGIAYSEEAYVILLQKETADVSASPLFEIDPRGLKVQKYTAAGATDGAKAWSDNPIWQAVDLGMSDKHGLALAASEFDFAVIKPEADYAATTIDSTEARSAVQTAQAVATKTCIIGSTEGFLPGRTIIVNGVDTGALEDVEDDTTLRLGTAATQSVGHTVVQRAARFESHIYMTRVRRATEWFRSLLTSCRGYVTYDAGKIQFRVERDTVKDRLTDGGFEEWSSPTDLTAGVETTSAGNTVNREATIKRSGSYALNLHRTASGSLTERMTLGTIEPGRWYRLAFYDYGGAAGLTNVSQIRIRNTTTGNYLTSDGMTWQSAATECISNTPANGAWTMREITFLGDPAGAATDSCYLYFVHNETTPVNGDVYFDDAVLRGPYAGDFRETTDAKLMGWKDKTFRWSLDRKDRESNRFICSFQNESGQFGPDEAVINDFEHQRTHAVKVFEIDGSCVADRDQATRIALFWRDKRRQLGTGCEFLGSLAALACQPGDVILVSATVPNWTRKEQRVVDVETMGLGDPDEHFVLIRTEDYDETIYADRGPLQFTPPQRPFANVNVVVKRNAGGVLDLQVFLDDTTYAVRRYRLYMGDASGFVLDATTLVYSTSSSRFNFHPGVDDLDVLRYFVVTAATDRGILRSPEFATTIFRAESVVSGYSNNFQFPTAVATPAGWIAFDTGTVANVDDTSDADYNQGTAHMTDGFADGDDEAIRYHSFGAGTGKTGRPYIRAYTATGGAYGTHALYYTLDRTAGSPVWVNFQTVPHDGAIADYFGPELTGVDYSKFAIEARISFTNGGFITRTITGRHFSVAFDEKA